LIQTAHDAGETYADIEKKFGVRPASMWKAIQTGKFHRTRENGWTVVRFTANQVKTDLVGCVDAVEKVLKLKRS
jgi:very-short-patch-repair endonuclease